MNKEAELIAQRIRTWNKDNALELLEMLNHLMELVGSTGLEELVLPRNVPSHPIPSTVRVGSVWGIDKHGNAIVQMLRGKDRGKLRLIHRNELSKHIPLESSPTLNMTFRISPEEREKLERFAKKRGLKPAQLIRTLIEELRE